MPKSRFTRKARQEIEELARQEAAKKRAHGDNPGQTFNDLSFQQQMAAKVAYDINSRFISRKPDR